MIYVGNTTGLLTFDGVKWRFYQCQNRSVIRSLAIDGAGRIYYGAKGEFGYLSSDAIGTLQLIPLSDHLPDTVANIGDVWDIACTEKKVYFQSRSNTFRFDLNKISSEHLPLYPKENLWIARKPDRGYSGLVAAGGEVYFQDVGRGLIIVKGDSLEILPGSEAANRLVVDKILPIKTEKDSEPRLLLVTKTQGLYEWDGQAVSPVALTPFVQGFLSKNNLTTSSIRLPNGHVAISTVQKGLLILDSNYQLVAYFNKPTGLASDAVTYAYLDRQGGLWLGTESGIARIEISSPLSFFSNSQGLEGNIYTITHHQKSLYLGTAAGIFATGQSPATYRIYFSATKIHSKLMHFPGVVRRRSIGGYPNFRGV